MGQEGVLMQSVESRAALAVEAYHLWLHAKSLHPPGEGILSPEFWKLNRAIHELEQVLPKVKESA